MKTIVEEREKDNGKVIRYIIFDILINDNFYRSSVSLNAFIRRKSNSETKTYRTFNYDEMLIEVDIWTRLIEKHPPVRQVFEKSVGVYVKNVWEMYKEIGYDYKKKKFADCSCGD